MVGLVPMAAFLAVRKGAVAAMTVVQCQLDHKPRCPRACSYPAVAEPYRPACQAFMVAECQCHLPV